MAQAHGDRLTALDASFLAQEGANSHMHVGAVMLFEGPPPAYRDLVNHIRSRLHLVPRYRQKLAVPPVETGRPLWVDDPSFNLEFHVRHTALPGAGQRGAAARARRADPLPAARPLQAAVGDLARPGARGQPLRADRQDPPRARRRHLRRRPRDRALRPLARARGRAARGRAVGARSASRAPRSSSPAASPGSCARRSSSPPARSRRRAARRPRWRSRARRSRASPRWPGRC